jgi:aspartate carbamoyltransferase catalytic subunit
MGQTMKLNHIIDSQQFTLPILRELFIRVREMEQIVKRGGTRDYDSKIMASLFYDSSSLTRLSFESAMSRLGGKVLTMENASAFFSVSPEDALEDTIRVVDDFCDVIVLRHNEIGGAARASKVCTVPLINAGDGKGGQHPTQALLDLYTIHKETNKLDGLKVALVGNLAEGRTVRSLSYLLSKFERIKLYFVSPESLQMKQDILDHLADHNTWYTVETDLHQVLPEVDVVYTTQIERERFRGSDTEFNHFKKNYFIDRASIELMNKNSIVLSPLPRFTEISREIDNDSRGAYFRQTQNGMILRMALLAWVLE